MNDYGMFQKINKNTTTRMCARFQHLYGFLKRTVAEYNVLRGCPITTFLFKTNQNVVKSNSTHLTDAHRTQFWGLCQSLLSSPS